MKHSVAFLAPEREHICAIGSSLFEIESDGRITNDISEKLSFHIETSSMCSIKLSLAEVRANPSIVVGHPKTLCQ